MRKNKGKTEDPFTIYIEQQTEEDKLLLRDFFCEFDTHCLMAKEEKRKLKADFERAILYYASAGADLQWTLNLLAVENLGGFYARPPVLWFPLDHAAKIYPLSMEHGRMAVFRLSVYLKKEVVPELLQMALNFTIKRFPTFATTLKKGFFWHYLDTAKRRFCAEEENDLPCQPLKVSHSGSQSFRLLYYKNRISVEFFHILTDGSGGMTFLKTLMAEYLRLTGIEIPFGETLWNINDAPATEEFENAFARVSCSEESSGFIDKTALQMSGRLSICKPCRIVHFKMDAQGLKEAAQKYNATVTAYLLALMFIAGKGATDQLKGDTSIQVPVNMRKFYPSKTVRNFAMYCGIRLPLEDIQDISSIVMEIQRQLEEKTSKEAMSQMLAATEKLVSMLKFIPLNVKQPVAKLVYGFLGDKIFSNTLSNLGVVQMPREVAEEIEAMDFVLGTAITNRVQCALVTLKNTATFSVTKLTKDPTFEEQIHRLLLADDIEVKVEGSGYYES